MLRVCMHSKDLSSCVQEIYKSRLLDPTNHLKDVLREHFLIRKLFKNFNVHWKIQTTFRFGFFSFFLPIMRYRHPAYVNSSGIYQIIFVYFCDFARLKNQFPSK